MKKKNQQLYSTERALVASRQGVGSNKTPLEPLLAANAATFPRWDGDNNDIFSLPFRGEQMSLGSSSGVHGKNSLSTLALTSALSFVTIFLSLFTLNYSSIFNLTSPTAHAADSTSSASLSISVPTSIQMSITSTDGDTTCDDDSTNTLCLSWSSDGKVATGSQTVSVQTNNPTGYTVTVDNGDGNLRGIEDNIKDQTISLAVKPTDKTSSLIKTTTMNESPNSITYYWTATPSDPNYLTTEGTYENKVAYVVTANDADANTVKPSTDDKVNTVYNFAYTGKVQTFTAPYDGKYKVEAWGAAGAYSVGGGYAVGETTLNESARLYISVGQGGVLGMKHYSYNGGGYVTCNNGHGGGGATSVQTVLVGDGQLKNYENNKDSVLIVAGGSGGSDGANWASKDGTEHFGSGGGYVGNRAGSPSERGASGGAWWAVYDKHAAPGGQTADADFVPLYDESPAGFGYGGSEINKSADDDCGGAGGGGWYGGQAKTGFGIGAGGSGYIGNSLLTNKHMYGYYVPTSDEESIKTISGSCVKDDPTADCAKYGNGYVRITYLGN